MKKYKLIIVENDEDEQMFMEEGFNAAGLFDLVTLVKNGDALFEWLRNHKEDLPDVILSDLNMPGKNGYDILTEATATPEYAAIPIVITSTSSVQMNIDKCKKLGAAHYLIKPDTFNEYEEFAHKLHDIISSRLDK